MKLSIFTTILTLFLGATANTFENFVNKFEKEYDTIHDYFRRKDIYHDNLKFIEDHNNFNNYKLEMNEFGDLRWEEFYETYIGNRPETSNFGQIAESYFTVDDTRDIGELPSSFDWSITDAVSPIKNQGNCGSCWAFSSTGALEGLYYVKNNKAISLSEQQLVDCSSPPNQGCNGGIMNLAFRYVARNGICSDIDYPYTSGKNEKKDTCIACDSAFDDVTGYKIVQPNNETLLQFASFQQPISIAIEADNPTFQFYSSGVYDNINCGTNLNHGVLLVGWGEKDNQNYWKVKNSWGESWGDKGYILLAKDIKNDKGQCGLAIEPSFPV